MLRRKWDLRDINAWLRGWCGEEGFGFLQNWADFSIGYRIFVMDDPLNEKKKMKKWVRDDFN